LRNSTYLRSAHHDNGSDLLLLSLSNVRIKRIEIFNLDVKQSFNSSADSILIVKNLWMLLVNFLEPKGISILSILIAEI